MRSGIGAAPALRDLGIDVVADRPGVGQRLHLRPSGVGQMRLTSADPTALPDVRLQLCSAPGDMARMLAANTVASRWNLLGGACMGSPDDPNAVVDDRRSVIGVEGLSVVDLSVVPVPIQAPAALTAMMIGEHAVDLLP